MKKFLFLALLFAAATTTAAEVTWLRYPAISPDGTQVAFTYKGDIWLVPTQGGTAKRFTNHRAYDYAPVWSPDGSKIAFASNRYGNFDIFTADVVGSPAKRITTHSNDERPWSYSPDGMEIYFSSNLQVPAGSRVYPQPAWQHELYASPVSGGRPRLISEITVEDISFVGANGDFLYHDRKGGRESEWRKHHTSPICRDLWICRDGKHSRLTDFAGEDRTPRMAPDGKTVYYLSERDGSFNVYSFPLSEPAKITRVTKHTTHPVRFLTIAGNGTLCYGYHGDIYIKEAGTEPRKITIEVSDSDQPAPRPTTQARISRSADADVTADGRQIAFVCRGNIFVTYSNTDDATTRQITQTIELEEAPSFAPDGRTLIYATEREGIWNIYKAYPKGKKEDFVTAEEIIEEPLFKENTLSRTLPQYSPDGTKIAYVEERVRLMVMDVATNKVHCVVDENFSRGGVSFRWSPDSKWLAFTANPNAHDTEVCLVKASGTEKPINLTQCGYPDATPRWVMQGNALLFQTTRNGSYLHSRLDGGTETVMILFLNRAAEERFLKSKRLKENHMMLPESERGKELVVETEGISERIRPLTGNGGAWGDVAFDDQNQYFYGFTGGRLYRLDLITGEKFWYKGKFGGKLKWNDSDRTLYILGGRKVVANSNEVEVIPVEGMMTIDREADRRYMFDHISWIYKDRFYLTNMHGIDWKMYCDAYRPFVEHINNNFDFAEMISELVGEANVSHTGCFYTPPKSKRHDATGEMGLFLNWKYAGNGLKVDEIIARGPFDRSDSKLAAGDVITKIGETEIVAGMDYYPLLNRTAGKELSITFRKSSGKVVEETIIPISRAALNKLLYKRWVRQNAKEVERLSNGRLGYVHIERMQHPNYRDIYLESFGRHGNAEGLVIDTRFNKGGRLHRELGVLFSGKQYLRMERRGVFFNENPTDQYTRPTIMLMNEANYSNGHGTPWTYKALGLGSLVGMPVAGTMTAVYKHKLRDKSLVFWIPTITYRDREGDPLENKPLSPDVKVENKKEDLMQGRDAQLEAAVKTLLEQLPNNPKARW